eukprot:7391877-Prymnesium_polylepis.3
MVMYKGRTCNHPPLSPPPSPPLPPPPSPPPSPSSPPSPPRLGHLRCRPVGALDGPSVPPLSTIRGAPPGRPFSFPSSLWPAAPTGQRLGGM